MIDGNEILVNIDYAQLATKWISSFWVFKEIDSSFIRLPCVSHSYPVDWLQILCQRVEVVNGAVRIKSDFSAM